MRMLTTVLTLLMLTGVSAATARAADPSTDDQKTFYALGLIISQSLAPFALTEAELDFVRAHALSVLALLLAPGAGPAYDLRVHGWASHEVTKGGQPIALTAKEFALLVYLCERRGKVLSRDHLLARVWGNRYDGGPRTVDIHVRRLRAKLGDALPLDTLRGSGYKLRVPDLPASEEE